MKRFLIFSLKSVCYDSYTFFAQSLADALCNAGHSVELFSAANQPLEAMEHYTGKTFDAVFDLNSELPRLKMDDDSYFLDHINAPFYDIILDHPLYHHDTLKQTIANFHVLCLDHNHCDYIKMYYPHIASADVFYMTGEDIAPSDASYPDKSIDLLFSGTYTSYHEVEDSFSACPGFMIALTKKLIGLMLDDPALTQEAALRALLPSLAEAEIIEEMFPLHMQACFLCDTWLRAYKREMLLLHLAKQHLPLTICGNGWEKSLLAAFDNVTLLPDTDFRDTFLLFRQSKVTLNLLPEFKNGTHDRIYSAMLNHCLCFTDASHLLEYQFTDGRQLYFYDIHNLENLSSRISSLLSDPVKLQEISQNGYFYAKKNCSWQARAVYLLSLL